MSDITAGDLAVFLEANPGPHRIGRYVVEHIGRFDPGGEMSEKTLPMADPNVELVFCGCGHAAINHHGIDPEMGARWR